MEMTVENGNVKISSEVISSIVSIAIDETEGFALAPENFIDKVFSKNEKAIKVTMHENDEVSITATVCVKYGLKINDEAKKLQSNILENLEIMTSLNINEININIISLIKETVDLNK